MTNERLRDAIRVRGFSSAQLAERLTVDPKTVERWVTAGRVPHRRHRIAVAELFGFDESYLWPDVGVERRDSLQNELVTLYPTRGDVPHDLWLLLVDGAHESIDALVMAGLFLTDNGPHVTAALRRRAESGVRVRLLLGDPECDAVKFRGHEEGIGEALAARIRISIKYLSEVADRPGVELRHHGCTLYNSIYRCDDIMLVNTHVYGSPASQNPVLHLRRTRSGQLFCQYSASFERVWEHATPIIQESKYGSS